MKIFFEEMTNLNITYEDYTKDPNIGTAALAGMYAFDAAVCVKFAVHFALYTKTITNLGTEKHRQRLERAKLLQDIGSFSLTEMGHGSNVRDIMTTAIFDADAQAFVLNTPHQLATKFWIGATADLANMTVVFAQLIVDSHNHGVHAFLVEIRDQSSHDLKPGVIVGDCGPKNGLNGIDNGFLIFNNVRVPLDNLLDRFSQVSKDGVFTTTIQDPDKRFATQLGSLSGGRITLSLYASVNSVTALTIAFRYAAVRQQFAKPGENEQAILEYPLTQYRLVPKLATTLVYYVASQQLQELWNQT